MIEGVYEKKIVIDSKRNAWLFYPLASGRTGYVVSRSRGASEAGHLIMDETVTEYDIIIDDRDDIHVVALTAGQRVVYSRHDFKGWVRYTLYDFAGKPVSISNLKIMKASGGLHLFYVYSEKGGGCALFHHQWTGTEWVGYRVFDMPDRVKDICYDRDIGKNNGLKIAAINNGTLLLWDFDGTQWTLSATKDNSTWEKTMYMEFREGSIMLRNDEGVFFVRDVRRIDVMHPQLIIEAGHIEEGPVLISRRNTLYIAWVEAGSLGYRASYDGGDSWGQVKYYHHTRGRELEIYGFDGTYSLLLNAKKLIATSPPDIHIPFLHRSVERIKLAIPPAADGVENGHGSKARHGYTTAEGGESGIGNYDDAYEKDNNGGEAPLTKGYGVEELKAEIEAMKQGVKDRFDTLESQITELRKEIKGLSKPGTQPGILSGSVITQDMINRYMRRR